MISSRLKHLKFRVNIFAHFSMEPLPALGGGAGAVSVPAALPSPRQQEQLWAGWRGGKELPLTARAGKDKLCPEHPARLCQVQAPGCAQPRRAARAAPLLLSLSPSASPDNTGMIAAQQDTGQGSGAGQVKQGGTKPNTAQGLLQGQGPSAGQVPLCWVKHGCARALLSAPAAPGAGRSCATPRVPRGWASSLPLPCSAPAVPSPAGPGSILCQHSASTALHLLQRELEGPRGGSP